MNRLLFLSLLLALPSLCMAQASPSCKTEEAQFFGVVRHVRPVENGCFVEVQNPQIYSGRPDCYLFEDIFKAHELFVEQCGYEAGDKISGLAIFDGKILALNALPGQ